MHRGQLTSLKLSPNLRLLPRDTRSILLEGDIRINFEINKMTKLLSLVRDPESVTNPFLTHRHKLQDNEVKQVLESVTTTN